MHRRHLLTAGVCALIAVSGSATASASSHRGTSAATRVVRHTYHSATVDVESGVGGAGFGCFSPAAGLTDDCLEATAQRGEHAVHIEMHDVSGLPVLGYLYGVGLFCGSIRVRVAPGRTLTVEAPTGVALVACAEPGTGTIIATFSSGR